ncbi:Uncharacterised protein [uncultured archaeon]|nr:Uncharacterised protein [uncultured archaeon]
MSENAFICKVTKAGTITIPKKLRSKYHIKVGDMVKYTDTNDGIKIVPSELSIVSPRIKAIWDEADKKKISIHEIVETVKEVRKQVYNEEY